MTLIRAFITFDAFMIELGHRLVDRILGHNASTARLG